MIKVNFKALIVEMLDKASEKQLKRLYYFIEAFLS